MHRQNMNRRAFSLGLLAAGLGVSTQARSAEPKWPSTRVTIIVPFPAGAATDITGRVMAAKLSQLWGQAVVIDNRGGGNGISAAEAAARAQPDGYTLFLTSAMTQAVNPALYAKLPYDPVKDFEPITRFGQLPFVVLVPSASPIKTLGELTALLKSEPGKHNFGAGSLPARVASELYRQLAGVDVVSVAYKSNPQAFPDLFSGLLTFMIIDVVNAKLQIDGGKMRGLAISSPQREMLLPQVPSATEAGLPGFGLITWTGFYAPHGTPTALVNKINHDIITACNDPGLLKSFESLGGPPKTNTPQEFKAFTASEIEKWGRIIRQANIKLD